MGWKTIEVEYSKKTVVQPNFFNPTIWGWLMLMPPYAIDPDFGDYRPSPRRVIDSQGMNAFMYFGPRIFHSLHLNAPRHDT
jgi:hypothetical protein